MHLIKEDLTQRKAYSISQYICLGVGDQQTRLSVVFGTENKHRHLLEFVLFGKKKLH